MKITVMASILALTASEGFAMESLSALTWKNRVVIVFGSALDKKLIQQIETLERQKDQLADRDMVVIRVSGDDAKAVYGNAYGVEAASLRSEVGVTSDAFQVVLVGKDGGVKLRSEKVVSDVEMFEIIDRMPMRRAGQK